MALFLLTFFVKMPCFLLHMWLPKAHVEAPVFGSIVLARVMLKMGGYGFLIFRPLLSYKFIYFFPYVFLFFSFYAAFICFRQKDLKVLIAYSRVNHMALVLMGIFSGLRHALLGAILLIIGHGVVSSIIFYIRRTTYSQTSSRSLIVVNSPNRDYIKSTL